MRSYSADSEQSLMLTPGVTGVENFKTTATSLESCIHQAICLEEGNVTERSE